MLGRNARCFFCLIAGPAGNVVDVVCWLLMQATLALVSDRQRGKE